VAGRVSDLIRKPASLIPTPAPIVEAGTLAHNLRLMADFFACRRAKLRPHFKSHKCVTIARRQLVNGNAVGITCAKVSEAKVLAAGGIQDILIANQIVGQGKVERVTEPARECRLTVAVDDESQVRQLSAAQAGARATVGVLVEVDVGSSLRPRPPNLRALNRVRGLNSWHSRALQSSIRAI